MTDTAAKSAELSALMSALPLPDLRHHVAAGVALIAEKEKSERIALATEIKNLATARGVAVEDLLPLLRDTPDSSDNESPEPAPKARGSVPPKYRDPAEPSQTWSGRGRKPKWVLEREAEGRALESMLISVE
jgi:DNA-binding protein H-NS